MKNQVNNDKFGLRNSDLKQTVNADLNFWVNHAVVEWR